MPLGAHKSVYHQAWRRAFVPVPKPGILKTKVSSLKVTLYPGYVIDQTLTLFMATYLRSTLQSLLQPCLLNGWHTPCSATFLLEILKTKCQVCLRHKWLKSLKHCSFLLGSLKHLVAHTICQAWEVRGNTAADLMNLYPLGLWEDGMTGKQWMWEQRTTERHSKVVLAQAFNLST